MKVLVACEESQAVCKEFRRLGHKAFSCDTQECSGGHPEWHIQGDVLEQLDKGWDMMIAFPPCTHLCVSGQRWFNQNAPHSKPLHLRDDAILFVKKLMDAPIDMICLENPISIISSRIRKPNQIIKPHDFGEDSSKKTCLWLKGLPCLKSTNIIVPSVHISSSGRKWDKWFFDTSLISDLKERSKVRSKTFPGIAKAMAEQWGNLQAAKETK